MLKRSKRKEFIVREAFVRKQTHLFDLTRLKNDKNFREFLWLKKFRTIESELIKYVVSFFDKKITVFHIKMSSKRHKLVGK